MLSRSHALGHGDGLNFVHCIGDGFRLWGMCGQFCFFFWIFFMPGNYLRFNLQFYLLRAARKARSLNEFRQVRN